MKIISTQESLTSVKCDALVIALFEGEELDQNTSSLDKAISSSISEAILLGDVKGKLYEAVSIYSHGKAGPARIIVVGAGKKGDFDSRLARNVIGAAARKAIRLGVKKLAVYLKDNFSPESVILGAGMASFDQAIYKTTKNNNYPIEELMLVGKADSKEINKANVVLEAINWTRKLICEPANLMTPALMVQEAKKLQREFKFNLEVISEREAAKRGFGAFAGIAKGSEEPSYIVSLVYKTSAKETLGIVGKGITFDSGGISLKPGEKMHEMKMDMAGAAVCFGLMRVVGKLRPKLNVVMVAPLTENLPGGRALKPGDVLKSLSGKTIEVLNTDAEGRVVLADALTYVQNLGAKKIVDLATLTGAVQVALGSEAAAILGNKQTWVEQVINSGKLAGERLWQLPLFPEHKELLKSDVADVANIPPSRGAGVIAGAAFLQEFVRNATDWAHLDIAATAWLDSDKPFLAKGPTGFGLLTLVKLLESLEG